MRNRLLIGGTAILLVLLVVLLFLILRQPDNTSIAPDATSQLDGYQPVLAPEPVAPEPEPPQAPPATPALTTSPSTIIEGDANNPFNNSAFIGSAGTTYYGIYYFGTEVYYTSGNSQRTPAASVIKVFIADYAYSLIERGALSASDVIDGQNVTSLITTMIQDSNNASANSLIDAFGMEAINAYLVEQGYPDTKVERRLLDTAARAKGLDNWTSLDDCLKILKKLYQAEREGRGSELLEIMKGQNVRTKIPVEIPSGVVIANKTGELDDVENDIGIVFVGNNDFAVIALSYNPYNSSTTRATIAELAKKAFDFATE
jgi:beta-lactamase class A